MKKITVELDRIRTFKFGMTGLSLIEDKLKKPLSQISLTDLTIKEMAILIWAGLVHEDKDLTIDKVMTLIDDYSNITEITTKTGQALQEAFGNQGEIEEEKN